MDYSHETAAQHVERINKAWIKALIIVVGIPLIIVAIDCILENYHNVSITDKPVRCDHEPEVRFVPDKK